jgi:hypothetical protein
MTKCCVVRIRRRSCKYCMVDVEYSILFFSSFASLLLGNSDILHY